MGAQRTSFIYRINKIKKNLDIDFNNKDTKLLLMIYCKLIELYGANKLHQAIAPLGLGLVIGFFIVDLSLFQSPTHLVSLVFGCIYCILASFVGKDRYPDETILLMGVDPKKLEKALSSKNAVFWQNGTN